MNFDRVKTIARGILGESIYKDIALQIDKRKQPNYEELKKNIALKDILSGRRCFILGNGPSLNQANLHLLKNEIVFTCNYFPQSDMFSSVYPLAHFISDSGFFINESSLNEKPLKKVFHSCQKQGVTHLFFNSIAKPYVSKYNLDNEFKIHYLAQSPNKDLNKMIDLCGFIPAFSTVIQSAICAAIYMGISEIYLLGCDCTGFVSYEKVHKQQSLESSYGFGIDQNSSLVLSKNMTSLPIEMELRNYAHIFDGYKQIADYCKKNNIRIFNLSKETVLEYIPRLNYLDVIDKIQDN